MKVHLQHRSDPDYSAKTPLSAKEHFANISELLSLAIASAKVKKLTVYEKDGPKNMRTVIHPLLRASTANFKSAMLTAVGKHEGRPVLDEVTQPGLVGSVDRRTMQLIPGVAWTCRNGVLLMDEFRIRRKSDDWTVFLKLLEDQTYTRKVALFSAPMKLEELYMGRDDLYLRQENGQIEMKTRFACIIATMKRFETHTGPEFKAFVNRTIPYEFAFNLDELERVLKGGELLKLKDFNPEPEVEIQKEEWFKIVNFVRKNLPMLTPADTIASQENLARTCGDIARIHAIQGNVDWRFAKKIINWKIDVYKRIGIWQRRQKEAVKT